MLLLYSGSCGSSDRSWDKGQGSAEGEHVDDCCEGGQQKQRITTR